MDNDRPKEAGRYAVLSYTTNEKGEEIYVDSFCRTFDDYDDAVSAFYSYTTNWLEEMEDENVTKIIVADSKTHEATHFRLFNWEVDHVPRYVC